MLVLAWILAPCMCVLAAAAPIPDLYDEMEMEMDMSNSMYFHVSKYCTILFREWNTQSMSGVVGSGIALAVLAALYEGYKVLSAEIMIRLAQAAPAVYSLDRNKLETTKTENAPLLDTSTSYRFTMFSKAHMIQTLLHVIQVWFSYMLMLAFMTYNLIICFFICLGAGLGYWMFAWRLSTIRDSKDTCF